MLFKCPGHDAKLYPGVRLYNRKVLCAPGPQAEKKRLITNLPYYQN